MIKEEDISPDELSEWRTNPVTVMFLGLIMDKYTTVAGSFERGELMDENNPSLTHGRVAKAWGQMEALDAVIEFMAGRP